MNKKSLLWVAGMILCLTAIPQLCSAQVENLAQNHSFEDEDTVNPNAWNVPGWTTWNSAEGNGGIVEVDGVEAIDGSRSLRVEPKGTTGWHFQVIQVQLPLEPGQEYTASLWAKADQPRPFAMQFKSLDNSTTWGNTPHDLTTEWAEYSTTGEALSNNTVKLELHCADSDIPLWLDFCMVYEGPYVAGILPSGLSVPVLAADPMPAAGSSDVPYDTDLSWTESAYAATHDVYFGTSWDDVNDATVDNPLDVLAAAGLTEASLALDSLAFNTTYFWRVDEVNAPPDSTVYKGNVWSFTTEPVAYPVANVTATASSEHDPDKGADNTVNGSGLNADDQHSANLAHMWLSNLAETEGVWIQYDLGQVHKLDRVHVWNHNSQTEKVLGYGIKEALIETSSDGQTWTELKTAEFSQGTGLDSYTGADVALDGVVAQYLRITALSNHSILGLTQVGLSEVRFYSIPVLAREPNPADNATSDDVDVVLQWRAGREAAQNEVVFSDDEQAVIDGSALVGTVAERAYDLGTLELGTQFFWKINSVGDATYEGDLWSFMTPDSLMIDDFEMYRAEEGLRIWEHWFDGFDDPAENGAVVGNDDDAEKDVVYEGRQSMPVAYDNSTAPQSEVTRFFDAPVDLTRGNPESLTLQVRGNAPGFVENADGTLTVGAAGNDIWNTADDFRFVYKRLSGDGSITAQIHSAVDVHEWVKAGVMMRENLDADATNAYSFVTPQGRVGTQWRVDLAGATVSTRSESNGTIALPYWIRLTRTGNLLKGEQSADGVTWLPMIRETAPDDPTEREIFMIQDVYIGLAVTSHVTGTPTVAVFSDVSTTGNVTGSWISEAIGADTHPDNDAAPMYVRLADTSGNEKTFDHPDPAATILTDWNAWTLSMADLSPVNPAKLDSMSIGVGGSGVQGKIFVDAIRTSKPYPEPSTE